MSESDRLAEDIRLLTKCVDEMQEAARANVEGTLSDRYFVLSSATLLSQFYTGMEKCLEKKFKLAGIPLPEKSEHYHTALLAFAIAAQFVPSPSVESIQDLRGFRHYARHAYGKEYRVDEIREKTANVARIWPGLKCHLLSFNHSTKDAAAGHESGG